ncbi:Potassium channel sub K member [Datura stramonium]|uniref:Potassium channel sub K member n=1 Tax=Datura stramonium TaxID=4076 RepID=A0ABS8RLC2_DATST|nr:Potassium channel sub K member [Datura stramonium]
MTTVGYGDLVPKSILAKLLACVFVFTGMALVGFVLSKAADSFLERQQILFLKALKMRKNCTSSTEVLKENKAEIYVQMGSNSRVDNLPDLQAADLDHDSEVSAAEFIVYKLKELGRPLKDISIVMESFKLLDLDPSGID